MNKLKFLVWVNPILFLCVVVQVITGIIMFFDMFASKLELISNVHAYNGFLLVVLITTHIALNWSWVKANFFKHRTVV